MLGVRGARSAACCRYVSSWYSFFVGEAIVWWCALVCFHCTYNLGPYINCWLRLLYSVLDTELLCTQLSHLHLLPNTIYSGEGIRDLFREPTLSVVNHYYFVCQIMHKQWPFRSMLTLEWYWDVGLWDCFLFRLLLDSVSHASTILGVCISLSQQYHVLVIVWELLFLRATPTLLWDDIFTRTGCCILCCIYLGVFHYDFLLDIVCIDYMHADWSTSLCWHIYIDR